ncbi:MAG: septation protein IspZ [Pseudomonadales bacterium]|jgi:intracellular septation protein|nr:septation protein IspZ [Pseudomonadales bacterium]MBP9034329.1 septation protein IspZ [Pseudomonadales bacterium]
MKQFAELIPVVLFFVVYQLDGRTLTLGGWEYHFDGIYSATAVLMITTVAQLVLTRLLSGHVEKRLLLLTAVVCAFGAATLLLRNQLFIQWKPTIFNWVLAAVFVGTHALTGKTVMERAIGGQLNLPAVAWRKLNSLWVANFVVVGALNLYVAYRFSEAAWVSYKLYSSIGFTLLVTALTVALIMPHVKDGEEPPAGAG